MTNNETPFGYWCDEPVMYNDDTDTYWDRYDEEHYPEAVTPVRTLAADEVAVKRYLASDAAVHLASIRPFTSDRIRAALDAAPAEPTAEDEDTRVHAGHEPYNPVCNERVLPNGRRRGACLPDPSPREASTPDCDNCGNQKCMDCATRTMHDRCEDNCPDCCTEPARPSLPDQPWTTVLAERNDHTSAYMRTSINGDVWRYLNGNPVLAADLARVQSYEILAEPPSPIGEAHLDDAYDKGWRDRGEANAAPAAQADHAREYAIEHATQHTDEAVAALRTETAKYADDKAMWAYRQAKSDLRAEIVAALRTVSWGDLRDLAEQLEQSGQQTEKENDK